MGNDFRIMGTETSNLGVTCTSVRWFHCDTSMKHRDWNYMKEKRDVFQQKLQAEVRTSESSQGNELFEANLRMFLHRNKAKVPTRKTPWH